MNGENALDLVRFHSGEGDNINSYLQLNRALREYCQATGFHWLKEIDDAALTFETSTSTYLLGPLGFRRIDKVWVQSNDTSRWYPLVEKTIEGFEEAVSDNTNDDGTTDETRPEFFVLLGSEGLELRVTPAPDENYPAKIAGVVATPVIERTKELPGPEEYHEAVVFLATGYELQRIALDKLKGAASDIDIAACQALKQEAATWLRDGRAKISNSVEDAFQNRSGPVVPKKVKLAR